MLTTYTPSQEWGWKMFTRHHLLCADGRYFLLPGEIICFHQQLVTLEPPEQKI